MKRIIFGIIGCLAVAGMALAASKDVTDSFDMAARHAIVIDKPCPSFFEGALLGNGGMGVVVTTRPDAVWLHFGHNNVWDIRVTENHQDEFGTFADVFAKADRLPASLPSIHHDKEFADYLSMTADNYRSPYPRPFPCGSVILGFDRRDVELLGHRLDVADGTCDVSLLSGGEKLTLRIFVDMENDDLWAELLDEEGRPAQSCFNRIRVLPDPATPADIPPYRIFDFGDSSIGFFQRLPYSTVAPEPSRDRGFSLVAGVSQMLRDGERTTTLGNQVPLRPMERFIDRQTPAGQPFILHVALREGEAGKVADRQPLAASAADMDSCRRAGLESWHRYWDCSGVELADTELERMWYRNLYFLNCAMRPGVTPPGIFGNWSYGNIGTAWHGDYHLNYNTQQPYWVTFSSNHLDKNLVYADLVDNLLPISRKWAREYYGMRGAFFPHSAYPVEMNTHPYPVPDWGWEVFETPWMVQGLWWHYLYSGDTAFLRDRAMEPMKDAVMFLVDYMTREDAVGKRWGDGKCHIFPSVPPELYGLQPGFKFNYDTQIDLALARFLFDAYLEAVDLLGLRKQERELVAQVKHVLERMPAYPTYESESYGRIFTSVPGEGDDIVFNVPASLAVVFPGEQYGLSSPDSIRRVLANTVNVHQNEGGNDIVFLPLQKARLGMLDVEEFKRQVRYATLPGGTVTDAVLQGGGRYTDESDYMYMAPMGIWIENFALPAVVNECLMQSYDGTIRLFPNWDKSSAARFSTLRARGGFLVSGEASGGNVVSVSLKSERGGKCRIVNPWPGHGMKVDRADARRIPGDEDVWEFATTAGGSYEIFMD